MKEADMLRDFFAVLEQMAMLIYAVKNCLSAEKVKQVMPFVSH